MRVAVRRRCCCHLWSRSQRAQSSTVELMSTAGRTWYGETGVNGISTEPLGVPAMADRVVGGPLDRLGGKAGVAHPARLDDFARRQRRPVGCAQGLGPPGDQMGDVGVDGQKDDPAPLDPNFDGCGVELLGSGAKLHLQAWRLQRNTDAGREICKRRRQFGSAAACLLLNFRVTRTVRPRSCGSPLRPGRHMSSSASRSCAWLGFPFIKKPPRSKS